MSLSQRTKLIKYEIVGPNKIIQLVENLIVESTENGVTTEIARTGHRRTITPVDDITNEIQELKDIANLLHTQELKDSYYTLVNQTID